jgi:hypothetical protein
MKITTQRTGGIWHGYLEGHPEVDERALTEEKAREKVHRILEARGWETLETPASSRKGAAAVGEP